MTYIASVELSEYLRILRANWVAIIVLVVIAVSAAGIFSFLQPKVYTAEASGYVATPGSTDIGSSMVGDQLAQSKVRSYVTIGTWRSVAEAAINELGLSDSPEGLINRVTVTNPADTVVLHISATGSTPEAARDLAEAWIRGMIFEIDKIEGADGQQPAVQLVPGDSARLPTAPSSPNIKMNLALGGLIGVLLGAGYAVLREWLDRRIRSAEGVETATGLSVVGTIPLKEGGSSSSADGKQLISGAGLHDSGWTAIAESFRGLRTNLQYMSVDDPPRVIVVTSPTPGDGKTFTASNLATALAQTGQRTVLIDADLRRPRIAKTFGVLADAGLTDALASRVAVADLLQPVDGAPGLQVLAAGPVPPNPSELLGSETMQRLLADLSKQAFVVVDAPPLLPVTDAAVLTTLTDGALVVVNTGKTTYEMLDQALGLLAKANGKALGVVMNRVPRSGRGALHFGYQYTDDYQGDPVYSQARSAINPEAAGVRSLEAHGVRAGVASRAKRATRAI